MTEDEMRAALAAAIRSAAPTAAVDAGYERIADALLPTVRRIVAEELRAAADETDPASAAWHRLMFRADALDPR